MELVTDAAGNPAPRLGEPDLTPEIVREHPRLLIQQIVRMLSVCLIQGDGKDLVWTALVGTRLQRVPSEPV
jgi:serine/threonine-protein kinase RIO1